MDFALARDIIDDRIVKMHIFREFYLDHEDFVSGMLFVSFYIDFQQS